MNVKFSTKFVAASAAAVMALSLAGCSGGSMDDSSSSSAKASGDSITIGTVTTNSGTAAAYGEAEVKGFELAVSEINAKGGINGKKVKLESAGRPVQAGHHRPGRHLRLHRNRQLPVPHLLQGLLPG